MMVLQLTIKVWMLIKKILRLGWIPYIQMSWKVTDYMFNEDMIKPEDNVANVRDDVHN